MRNGNYMRIARNTATKFVLILPMRNGNNEALEYMSKIMIIVLILPMRNGNQ